MLLPTKCRRPTVWLTLTLMALALAGLLTACEKKSPPPAPTANAATDAPAQSPPPAPAPLRIVASIFPLQNIAAQLTEGIMPPPGAQVMSLMPPGVSPHDFEPTADQMAGAAQADLVLVVGLNLDPWAQRAAKQGRARVLCMADMVGVTPAPEIAPAPGAADDHDADHDHDDAEHPHHDHAGPNQHLWLDLGLMMKYIPALADELSKAYPAQAMALHQRAADMVTQLQQMDDQFRRQLADVPNKELITFHNAFNPLAERYGLHVAATLTEIELAPGGEVTPQDLVEAIDAVRKYHILTVYAEPQFPSKAVDMLAEQTGAKVLLLDPEGNPNVEGYRTYQDMLRSNVAALVKGQSAGAHP